MGKQTPQKPEPLQTLQLKEGGNSWGGWKSLPCSDTGLDPEPALLGYKGDPKCAQHGAAAASKQTLPQ